VVVDAEPIVDGAAAYLAIAEGQAIRTVHIMGVLKEQDILPIRHVDLA